MSDQAPNTPDSDQTSGANRDNGDLARELREMSQQLEAAFRAALESDKAKQLQRDLAGGVRELATQVQSAVKSVQENPRVQQAEERGREAFSKAQQSQLMQDVQETIVTGITQLNLQLRKLVDRLETTPAATSSPSTQNVPVENENAATGQTTRLDDSDQTSL